MNDDDFEFSFNNVDWMNNDDSSIFGSYSDDQKI